MTKKIVHVNEYVKDDGTYVREHYRGLPSGSENYISENTPDEAIQTLYGGISEDVPFEKQAAPEQLIPAAGSQIGDIIARTLFAAADVLDSSGQVQKQNFTNGSITGFEPAINDTILRLLEAQEEADKQEAETLQKLVTTKDTTEYKNLYNAYQQQKAQNKEAKTAIANIQRVVNNNNNNQKNKFLNETKKLVHAQNEILRNNSATFLQGILGLIPEYILENRTTGRKITLDKRTGLHDFPEIEKRYINYGMKIERFKDNCYDADELWKAAAYNFQQSKEYISQNGYLLNSTSALPPDLQKFVRRKVKEQLGVNDAKGIMFKPDSTLSQAVVKSPELKTFIQENKESLQNGQIVNGSKSFSSTKNLSLALGNADIYNAYIDEAGNFRAYVIDTYDFNKNDPRWTVEWAYNVQENGLITNFYTVNTILIPREQLYEFIFN